MLSSELAQLIGRLGMDVLCLILAIAVLYRRRHAAPEMTLVFTALNLGLFAAVTVISTNHFPVGVGFGLFGLLSLVRLRSTTFTLKDVAYTFVVLIFALVNGLPSTDPVVIAAIDVLLLVGLWVADVTRSRPATRLMRLTLDRACTDVPTVRQLLSDQLPPRIVSLAIDEVDHVRDLTRVLVRHEVDDTWLEDPLADEPARVAADD
jgi:hypothetical protein